MIAYALILGAAVAGAGCSKAAAAQQAPDPLGPVRCYQAADVKLSELSARALCTGAASEAPYTCWQRAVDGNELSESQALTLCFGATSTAPADCAAQLGADGQTANQTIVNQCAGKDAYVAPSSNIDACVAAATDDAGLSTYEAGALCVPGRG